MLAGPYGRLSAQVVPLVTANRVEASVHPTPTHKGALHMLSAAAQGLCGVSMQVRKAHTLVDSLDMSCGGKNKRIAAWLPQPLDHYSTGTWVYEGASDRFSL